MSDSALAATRVFWDPAAYADQAAWHATVAEFRRSEPVVRVGSPHHRPFWAVTRHADIHWIERHPEQFPNTDRSVLATDRQYEAQARQGAAMRTLIHMDGEEHRKHRAVTATWFKPTSVRSLEAAVTDLARRAVDRMAELGGRCDFVADVALYYPLRVILSILGLPEDDEPRMLRLTQELFGSGDPCLRRPGTETDLAAVIKDFYRYFTQLAADRRAAPTADLAADLAGVIANADIDGRPLEDTAMLSYFVLIATAGHDTTSATLAGGLSALIDHPEQLALLRREPARIGPAVGRSCAGSAPSATSCATPRSRPSSAASGWNAATPCCCRIPRPTGTTRSSTSRSASTSAGPTPSAISASASASTTASAPTSPAWS